MPPINSSLALASAQRTLTGKACSKPGQIITRNSFTYVCAVTSKKKKWALVSKGNTQATPTLNPPIVGSTTSSAAPIPSQTPNACNMILPSALARLVAGGRGGRGGLDYVIHNTSPCHLIGFLEGNLNCSYLTPTSATVAAPVRLPIEISSGQSLTYQANSSFYEAINYCRQLAVGGNWVLNFPPEGLQVVITSASN
jgi:hypothetical protein